ncbi:response regulator [Deminuibacter soli]|nr:response regulator [Deminuibacter soli]
MPIKIVVVEDDIDDRLFISGALEETGEIDIVGFAENFDELADILNHQRTLPDGILCDIRLPGSTGWEMSEKCKHIPAFEQVPFVLMSGTMPSYYKTEAAAPNIAAYIVKPSLLQEYRQFKQQILDAIQQYKMARSTGWRNWAPRLFNGRQHNNFQDI